MSHAQLPDTSVELRPGTGKTSTPEEIEEAKKKIFSVLEPLSPKMRERVLMKLDKQYTAEEARFHASELERQIGEKRQLEARKAVLNEHIAALDALVGWFETGNELVLEANTCSRLHHLKDARVYGNDAENPLEKSEALRHVEHTFVVKHDWANAFDKAEGLENCVRLPYDICAFEFRITGKSIICVAAQKEDHDPPVMFHSFMLATQDIWYSIGGEKNIEEPVVNFMWKQIQAICIALDADVATHEVVRASESLNAKRLKAGKTPLASFHVIDLARRHRIANPMRGEPTGRRVRLHFRRGHWRHYDDHRTWIKWMLVGNPDLGFIQKHYAL